MTIEFVNIPTDSVHSTDSVHVLVCCVCVCLVVTVCMHAGDCVCVSVVWVLVSVCMQHCWHADSLIFSL